MQIEGRTIRLRAVEPTDIDPMYVWENDYAIWHVSGTTAPFSRHTLQRFLDEQQFDPFRTGQQRLIIEPLTESTPIGALDLFELDPIHRRAGLGILIHDATHRRKGYAADAIDTACRYAREVLGLHQLWCNIADDNQPSLALFHQAGFTEAGVKRDWQRRADGYHDELTLQKILE